MLGSSPSTISGTHVETGTRIRVTLAGGRIAAIEPAEGTADLGGPDVWISPGFIDLQLNGYAGANFNHTAQPSGDDPYGPILDAAARSGTASETPPIPSRRGLRATGPVLRSNERSVDPR